MCGLYELERGRMSAKTSMVLHSIISFIYYVLGLRLGGDQPTSI